jgi:nitrous oxide reductase accessory protein NosL
MKARGSWCGGCERAILAALLVLLVADSDAPAAGRAYIKPAPKDKCPVCGMFVAKYPDWVAEAVFRDGSYVVFDGAKDLFHYLVQPGRYVPGREDIDAVYVTDYYAVTPIDARNAFYVIGSNVFGPMGAELVPFKNEAEAREFLKDHEGKRILRFREITQAVLKTLP